MDPPDLDHLTDAGGKEEERLAEDDGHDAGVVDLEGHVLGAASIDLASDDALGVLDWNFALGLGNADDAGDHDDQETDHDDEHHGVDLATLAGA